MIHTEYHAVLKGLKGYGYPRIDDSSKVLIFMKGINTTEVGVCKAKIMDNPSMHASFTATFNLYSTFIMQMKADNLQEQARWQEFIWQTGFLWDIKC
jgi:hypothetical protein